MMQKTVTHSVYRRRLWLSRFNLTMSWLTMAFGLFWLGWIFYTVFYEGLSGLGANIFQLDTPPPSMEGGLRNAIWGSLMITFFGLLIGTPVGIMCGIYLAEFGRRSKLAAATRFMNDILLSAPSIVIGLFIYGLVVVRTTENMLRLVPDSLREAAYALGTPKWKLVSMVTLRAAKAGVLTGVLLAFARISGETAPLLFTALNNQFFSHNMNQPMANLPNVIYQFAMSPYQDWHALAWAAALLIALTVLSANIAARILGRNKH